MNFVSLTPSPLMGEGSGGGDAGGGRIPARVGPRVSPISKRNRNTTHPLNAILNYDLAVLESKFRIAVLPLALIRQSGIFIGGTAVSRHSCSTF
jgi:hypothetical protein